MSKKVDSGMSVERVRIETVRQTPSTEYQQLPTLECKMQNQNAA